MGHHEAKTVRSKQADVSATRGREHLLFQSIALRPDLLEARRNNHSRADRRLPHIRQ